MIGKRPTGGGRRVFPKQPPVRRGKQRACDKIESPEQRLSELFAMIGTPEGNARLLAYLSRLPFPHYETTEAPGASVRIEEDGRRTGGSFAGRESVKIDTEAPTKASVASGT